MQQPGNDAGTRKFAVSALLALAAGALALAGCNLLIPSATTLSKVELPSGQGAVRQFSLGAGEVHMPLPASRNLLLMLSASGSAPSAVSFRVQGGERLGGDARFTADSLRRLASAPRSAQALARPAGVQNIPLQRGFKMRFWVNTGSSLSGSDCYRWTSLEHWSPHAYFFVDTGPADQTDAAHCGRPADPPPSPEMLERLAAAFEGQSPLPGAQPIFHTITQLFGHDPTDCGRYCGPDGDPRVFFVISPAVDNFGHEKGLMGYFWSRDLLRDDPHSNQKDAVFLTSQIFNQKPYTTYGSLAHEFMHLVMFEKRLLAGLRNEDTWWDEALSMLAMDLTGYGLRAGNEDIAKDIRSFLERPQAYSLTQWLGNPNNFAYGLVYLFARYLHDRFGPDFIREAVTIPDGGVVALERALRRRIPDLNPGESAFERTYANFMAAIYTSGTRLEVESRYRLAPDLNLRASYGAIRLDGVTARRVASFVEAVRLRPWGTAFFELAQEHARPWSFNFNIPEPLFGSAIGW